MRENRENPRPPAQPRPAQRPPRPHPATRPRPRRIMAPDRPPPRLPRTATSPTMPARPASSAAMGWTWPISPTSSRSRRRRSAIGGATIATSPLPWPGAWPRPMIASSARCISAPLASGIGWKRSSRRPGLRNRSDSGCLSGRCRTSAPPSPGCAVAGPNDGEMRAGSAPSAAKRRKPPMGPPTQCPSNATSAATAIPSSRSASAPPSSGRSTTNCA